MENKAKNWGVWTFSIANVALVASGLLAYMNPDLVLVWQILLEIAVVAYVATLILYRGNLKELFSKKTARYGLNSVFMSFVMFLIIIFVNMIAANHDIKQDFTKDKIHTLSEQSQKLLKGLGIDIKLRAFANPTQVPEFEKIFSKYTYYTNRIKPEFVDVDKEPGALEKYKIRQAGTIIVESETRNAKVDNLSGADDPKLEEKLTNAIIQVAKGEKKKLYFVTGHGEKLPNETNRDGFSEIKESLENSRYKVEELTLVDKDKVPADAEIVVLAGPKSDLLDHEAKKRSRLSVSRVAARS